MNEAFFVGVLRAKIALEIMHSSDQAGHTLIPIEHDTGRRALDFVIDKLQPYIVTLLAQGNDYGLDAYVEQIIQRRVLKHTNVQFAIQSKGTLKKFSSAWSEPLEIKHLIKWEAATLEVLVAVTSVSSETIRWRFAHDIIDELDKKKPNWRTKEGRKPKEKVAFREQDEITGSDLHSWLERKLGDLLDKIGGKKRLHRYMRRVLLTELYHDYAYVGQRGSLAAERPDGPVAGHFITGLQWQKGEINERYLSAYRVLSGALLLFDEIYFPSSLTYAAVAALGPGTFLKLLESGRLIPVGLADKELTFLTGSENKGDLYFFQFDSQAVQENELVSLQKKYNLRKSFVTKTISSTKRIVPPRAIEAELLDVTKSEYIRDFLSLGKPLPQSKEPIWSAERLLRIGNIVNYYMIADQLSVDVVEMESGLARIALARWGSRLDFHRVYKALDELEAVLAASAMPDMGELANHLGMRRCLEISDSVESANFREWFWNHAADALDEQGSFDGEVAARIAELSRVQQPLPHQFMVASSESLSGKQEGWASRPGAEDSLQRQKAFSADRLKKVFANNKLNIDNTEQSCPCGQNASFGECCGRILSIQPPTNTG